MAVTFTWDPAKNAANQRKHGVSFDQAVEALFDPLAQTVSDDRHPAEERRYFSIGQTRSGRLLTVGHTDEDDVVRIITAREATPREKRAYED
ncbi:BrnT family toxin [Granulicella rosea]|uniref:BrnT family toxin n=1 Tax=Granulicella rosea TaxID=474952 RepID=UPI000B77A5FA|nr:BrnT family toxin [Granulicella rosea]